MSGLTNEQSAFLCSLQKELQAQSEPNRPSSEFWVVMTHQLIPPLDNDIDLVTYFDCDGSGETITPAQLLVDIHKDMCQSMTPDEADDWLMDYDLKVKVDESGTPHIRAGWCVDEEPTSAHMRDAIEAWADIDGGKAVFFVKQAIIAYGSLFLTRKACVEHILANRDHYLDPYPTCAVPWRSPQVTRLLEILRTADFSQHAADESEE